MNPTLLIIEALGNHLEQNYLSLYGPQEPLYPKALNSAARMVLEHIANSDALRYLQLTQEGKQWIANLHSHVFAMEHGQSHLGPFCASRVSQQQSGRELSSGHAGHSPN